VLHADETPIKLLSPGSGKTATAYAWVIRSSDLETTARGVVYEFCNSRQGQHAATLPEYELERQGGLLDQQERLRLRPTQTAPLLQEFKAWLLTQRQQLMNADVTAKAMDYTLKRWLALTLHLSDARIPIDNNAVENAIRPLALGRKNWPFAVRLQAGERAVVLGGGARDADRVGQNQWT
jgi:transposase